MKSLVLSALAIFLAATIAMAVSVDDIIKLKKAGAGDDVIINFVDTSEEVPELSVDDIIQLKKNDVSEAIINHILVKGKKEPPPPVEKPDKPAAKDEKDAGDEVKEPEYIKKFDSIFSLKIYEPKAKKLFQKKLEEYGLFNPLKNKAKSAGIIYLTEAGIVFIEDETTLRWEIKWTDITSQRIKNNFPGVTNPNRHKLTHYSLEVFYKEDGEERIASMMALPKPRKPSKIHASVQELAQLFVKIGGSKNPAIKPPEEVWK